MNSELTPLIAIYGALLSTLTFALTLFFRLRELRKDKGNLKVILEYVSFYEFYRVRLVNNGFRRISIVAFSAYINIPTKEHKLIIDHVPPGSLLVNPDQLPVTLDDGEAVVLNLQHVLSEYKNKENGVLIISAFDAEGKEYNQTEELEFNGKYDHYD